MACGPLFFGPPRSLGAPARSWRRSCRFPRPGRAPMRQERASTPHAPASARTACTRTSKAQNAPADLATARPCERSTASRSPSSDCSSMADPSRHARAAAAPRSVAIARRSARDVSTSASMEHVCRPMESEFDPRHGRHGLDPMPLTWCQGRVADLRRDRQDARRTPDPPRDEILFRKKMSPLLAPLAVPGVLAFSSHVGSRLSERHWI